MPVIKDVVCSLCGCLCDDITVTVEDNKIMGVKNACILGHSKTVGVQTHVMGNAGLLPAILNNGGTIIIEGSTEMPASEMKKGTVIIRGKVKDLLPSYVEEGTEEVDGILYQRFAGDVNVSGKGVLLMKQYESH